MLQNRLNRLESATTEDLRAELARLDQGAPNAQAPEVQAQQTLQGQSEEVGDALSAGRGGPIVEPPPPVDTQSDQREVAEVPLSALSLSDDVPQFKAGARNDGVVEALGGSFDRRGVAPIQVWERKDGRMEVVSGRHRFDLAKRSGEQSIPAQVYREADGFSREQAATLDAELNIRDGQGSVADYVGYFRNAALTRKEAEDRGLLSRAKGKAGWRIADSGSPELIAALDNQAITDQAAEAVAINAPGNARLQNVALQSLMKGESIGRSVNLMRAVQAMSPEGQMSQQGDMFGLDDSAMVEAAKMARTADSIQRGLREQVSAVSGAARRPEQAAKLGVNVADPDGVRKRIDELRAEAAQWDNWMTDPSLVARVRQEAGLAPMTRPEVATEEEGGPPEPAAPEGPGLFDEAPSDGGFSLDDPRPERSEQQADAFGRNETAQALADRARAQDTQRNGTRDVSAGVDGGLFSDQSRQTDAFAADTDAGSNVETPVAVAPENRQPSPVPREDSGKEPASWVIRNRETGEVIMETFDRKKVEALKTEKYEAVPIQKHLASLNNPSVQQVTKTDVSQARASLTSQVQARIDAMKGADVHAAARALERETGVKLPFGKAKAREAVADAVAQFPQATAERFGVPFDDDARRVFTAELEGRVIAEGSFGPVFSGLSNQPEAAIEKLMAEKRGEVPDAFTHPELGPIAFVYGDEKMGLRHIEAKRDRAFVDQIPGILREGRVTRDQGGLPRAYVTEKGDPDRVAVIRLDWDGEAKTWLVTAFPMGESGSGEQGKGISPLPTHSDAPFLGQKVGAEPDAETTPAPESSPAFTRPQIDEAVERAVQKVRILVAGKDAKDLRAATGVSRPMNRSDLEAEAVRQAQENPLAVADALGIELAPEVRAPLEQLYGQTPNTPAPAVADAQAGRLDDFGEKLGGARKDESPSLDREITDADIAAQPLSKIWPKSEIDAVEDKFIAALLTAARAEIPAKPRKGYKLTRWVQTVQQMRGMARTVQAVGRGKIDDLIKETPSLGNWYSKVRLMEAIDREQWPRIGGVVEAPDAYTYIDGERVNQPAVMVDIDGRKSWFQGFGDIDGALPRIREKLAGTEPAASKMQFEIRIRRKDGKVFINKKGDSEQRALREFDNPKQARAFVNDNYDDLVAEWEGVKDRDNVRKSDVRRSENRPRTGADRRNGRDADEAMFSEAFGFRGVEFGNWLQQGTGQKDRQGMLNEVYDALMDLSDVVGVPPRAMSLGGTLGLGLGSRGKGGKAAAHFEPDTLVINLTKTKGAGSLAHEWFHALDNYFARKRDGGESFQGTNFITYKPEPLMVRKDRSRLFPPMTRGQMLAKRKALGDQTDNFNDDKWERDPSAPQGVRPEGEERFADLVEALNDSPMAARARLLDSDKKAYWSQIIERGARSFENYVISKMMEKGYQNDFLANVVALEAFTRDKGRYPYLMPEEVAPVARAFDALFDTIETQQDGDNVVLFSRDGQSAADQTQTAEFKRWFGDSKVVDADGKPLVVYHGSPNAGFTVFDEDRAGSNTQNARAGFFFTESKKNAETYSGRSTEAKLRDDFDPDYDGEAGVYPVYLSIPDPLEVDFGGRNWDGALEGEYDGHESVPEIVDQAKAAGYDGVIIRNVTDEGRFGQGYHWGNETYVAFRPEQVKSATGNRGTFDPADPDISRLQSGTVPASNRPDAPEWERSQVERLNGILARQAGQEVPLRAVETPKAMRGMSEMLETLLGRKAVFFESSDPRAPAGVYVSGGVLFVNADAKQPLRHVLGHEFTHSLEGPAAELHAILKARVLEMAKAGAFPAYEARLEKVYQRDGLPKLSRAKVENEFVADVMGSIMSDPKVLFDLKQRMEPSAFQRLVNAINAWIDGLMARLRGDDMRQSDFAQRTMRDLDGIKALVGDVLQATRRWLGSRCLPARLSLTH